MSVTECSLKYTTVPEGKVNKISAIIVCGGSSSRMKGIDKIFAEICDVPVAIKTISTFNDLDSIKNIIVVAKKDNILKMQQLCEKFKLNKVTDIVEGGSCRQQSVANGMKMCDKNTDYVLVHDGARPLVTKSCIERVIKGAIEYSAVTCAVKLKDTVKVTESDGLVTKTPDRNKLVSVQTPQGFCFDLYSKAIESNKNNLDKFTDDCSVVESFGYPVYVVEGDYNNIKITTSEDLKYAEFLINREGL